MKNRQLLHLSQNAPVSIHGGGSRDSAAMQVQGKQEENKVKGAERQLLALLTHFILTAKEKQPAASLNLAINFPRQEKK